MKTALFNADRPSTSDQITPALLPALSQITPAESTAREPLRHILGVRI